VKRDFPSGKSLFCHFLILNIFLNKGVNIFGDLIITIFINKTPIWHCYNTIVWEFFFFVTFSILAWI